MSEPTIMRLTEQEKTTILETIHDEDPTADIFLFGSRLDDARKGGDIDLYVETGLHEKLLKHKARILFRLWEKIGVQRIDIILKPRNSPLRAIHREAKTSGVRL
jgi:predicted nucleotidyltransferase